MISQKMEKALCEQVNAEIYSAYLYLSMSSWFDSVNLSGFAGWMKAQAQEEMVHAMKLYDYVGGQGHGLFMMDRELGSRTPPMLQPAAE